MNSTGSNHEIQLTEQVWLDLKSELKNFILSSVKNTMETEDILQDVFVKVHLNLGSLKNRERLKSWVYQIARNTVQDYFRNKRYAMNIDTMNLAEEKSPRDHVNFEKCMIPFVKRLPKNYREALILADVREVEQVKLAKRLQLSYSGLKSRVQRARQLLLGYFMECCDVRADKYGNIVSHTPKGNCLCS